MKKYYFRVEHPGEPDAGMIPYTDRVEVSIESGHPGGEEGEFESFMTNVLSEWFVGATVWEEK